MGTDFYGRIKPRFAFISFIKFHLNNHAKEEVDYLCWGIKKLYGIYAPLDKNGCLLAAKILRNKINTLRLWKRNGNHNAQDAHNIFVYRGIERDYLNSRNTIKWLCQFAYFLENIEGLVSMEGYNED